jgi:hypothetical protein
MIVAHLAVLEVLLEQHEARTAGVGSKLTAMRDFRARGRRAVLP